MRYGRGYVRKSLISVWLVCMILVLPGIKLGEAKAAFGSDWLPGGVPFEENEFSSGEGQIVADGGGGAYLAWIEEKGASGTDYRLYVQHLDSSGDRQWGTAGKAACDAGVDQRDPQVAEDGSGGLIVIWVEDWSTSGGAIYGQRFDQDGNSLWGETCLKINPFPDDIAPHESEPAVVTDESGTVYIVWEEDNTAVTSTDLFARVVFADGSLSGTYHPSTAYGSQVNPKIIMPDSTHLVVAWTDNTFVYAQRFNLTFTVDSSWGGAKRISDHTGGGEMINEMIPDGSGGVLVAWSEAPVGYSGDLYLQRLAADGNPIFDQAGVEISGTASIEGTISMVGDGAQGAVLTWADSQVVPTQIYAQRIDGSGTVRWSAGGIQVTHMSTEQWYPRIAADKMGWTLIWQDYEDQLIYSQYLDQNGYSSQDNQARLVSSDASAQTYPLKPAVDGSDILTAWLDDQGADPANAVNYYAQKLSHIEYLLYLPIVIE